MTRARGATLLEITAALTFACVLVGVSLERIASEEHLLRITLVEDRADALLDRAYERLRAGLVPLPPDGAEVALETSQGVTVSIARAALDARLGAAGTTGVTLRARWKRDGREDVRELATIVGSSR